MGWITATLLIILAFVSIAFTKRHPLSDEYIAEINQKQSLWKAGRNFDLGDWERVKKISSGLIKRPFKQSEVLINIHNEKEYVPEFYDLRAVYPQCESLTKIYDQANCGSCWAFCAVEAMSDRICIRSQQTKQILVSVEDAMSCCPDCGNCDGGSDYAVWQFWGTNGLTSGGRYNNTNEGCKPYFLPPCDSSGSCHDTTVPPCDQQCANPKFDYYQELTYGENQVAIFRNEKQIQLEILKNGPVSTSMLVFSDFPNYQSGIYKHTTEETIGSHCIKIVGWGVENNTKYWILANSWNENWGENGFFRIIRGTNDSGIEGAATSVIPKLDLTFNQN